jgi:hypothetical protein
VAKQLQNRTVLVQAQTTSDVCQLIVFEQGQLVRALAHADGQLLRSSGSPLPGEPTAGADAETSEEDDDAPSPIHVAHDVCAALGFELWRSPPLRGPGHIWKKRSLLARLWRA